MKAIVLHTCYRDKAIPPVPFLEDGSVHVRIGNQWFH